MKSKKVSRLWLMWVATVVAALGLFSYAFRGVFFGEQESVVETPEVGVRHPFSGVGLPGEIEKPRVYGIMIENMVEARPQAGLDKAALVIEAPVEASIPRMIAFFTGDQEVSRIGPVRSARPYFIDWNAMFGAVFAHVGGSPEALARLRADDTIDLDEVSNEWFYWRDRSREAPHNVYTSIELLENGYERFAKRFGEVPISYESFTFKNAEPKEPTVPWVRVSLQTQGDAADDPALDPYTVEWEYDAAGGLYKRFQGGEAHVMEDGAEIWASNVVVMPIEIEILDTVGRRRIRTIGEGEAFLFQDGQMRGVKWMRALRGEAIRFVDVVTGEEVPMNAGSTWIEVVASESQMSFPL